MKEKNNMFLANLIKETGRIVIINFFHHDVGRNSAALSYYLVFALFPLLIFANNLLGLLNLDVISITKALLSILPNDIVDLLENYLLYVSKTSNKALFWFSLIFSIYFPMRVAKGLMDSVRKAYKLDKPTNRFSYIIRHFLYTLILFTTITITLILSITGEHVLEYITNILPVFDNLSVSNFFITLWQYLRFFILGIVMFISLGSLYSMAHDSRKKVSEILPGTIIALFGWLIVSMFFSFYVENFANYSVIYGTLGAVIVLLIWLYVTSVILILGAEINATIDIIKASKGS